MEKDRFVYVMSSWSLTQPKFHDSRLRALESVNMAVQRRTAYLECLAMHNSLTNTLLRNSASDQRGKKPRAGEERKINNLTD